MKGGRGRRRPTDTFNPQPTPEARHFTFNTTTTSRDSDASFASSRPSSIGVGRPSDHHLLLLTDRSQQASAVRSINAYLSSHSSLLSVRTHPVSSAKEITEILQFILSHLDYPNAKLEEDLLLVLKSLNCPYKVNKSTLRAPNTLHNWPTYLALINWLVQLARYAEHLSVSGNARSFVENNSMLVYALDSYLNYIRGEDDVVEALDRGFMEKLERERDQVLESVRVLEEKFRELELLLERLRMGPTEREKLDKEKAVLEEDLSKFHKIILDNNLKIEALEKVLQEKEKELGAKVDEKQRINKENEELKNKVDVQSFNARDAERMKRELQAVERDIAEAEDARNTWEERAWHLNSTITHTLKELEALAMDCNQAVRRLKLANGFQYVLNANGSTPAEVMGIDYKSIIKPRLKSFAQDIKKSSTAKLEELASLQKLSSELNSKVAGKRTATTNLQSHIDEVESQLSFLKKEIQDHTVRYAAETKKMIEDVQNEAHNLDLLETEAAEILTAARVKLQEAMKQTEEEIQLRARDLFSLVDSASKYKEHVELKISEMKSKLSLTAVAVSDAYKGLLPPQPGSDTTVLISE